MPWAFTQSHPLDTSRFIDEAKQRGIELDLSTLRELYRYRLLIPFVELTYRPVRPPNPPSEPEPMPNGSRLMEIRKARDEGCLRDLATEPFKPRLPFERGKQKNHRWWNGLIYTQYQLLAPPMLEDLLNQRTYQRRGTHRIARLPEPHPFFVERMEQQRRVATAITALEARYLPKLDPELILLNGADWEKWEPYRQQFDPVQTRDWLQYPAEQVRQDAEDLLLRARNIDPVGNDWSRLMRRAPAKARKYLEDAALQAMDLRIAAEILLLFYEDLAGRGQAEPLPDLTGVRAWHPLHERLSYRPVTLDETLVNLGISPHPRVVLALEGETEMYHAPRVQAALEFTDAPELIRLLKLGTANRDLVKVAALAAAPLVSEKVPGTSAWKLIKPYTRLFVAVDPDSPFTSPERVAREREKILDEIKEVLKAQGVEHPNPEELDYLVEIRTWDAPCYEFAHFTDEELADGIMAVHPTINGWTREELVEALAYWRARNKDIKRVWESGRWVEQSRSMTGKWTPEPSKPKLAEELWPTLLKKIQLCMSTTDAPVPPIARVINDAYHIALRWRDQSYVLTEVPPEAAGADTASSDQ
jgi:hypothetical protein